VHLFVYHSPNQGITLEETLGVLIVKLEELTSSTTNLGESQSDSPDFTLVSESVFTG
jgi:hypothetical protein